MYRMVDEVKVRIDGEMPLTYSTNLAFTKPGPYIPTEESLEYCGGVPNAPELKRVEMRAIHLASKDFSRL